MTQVPTSVSFRELVHTTPFAPLAEGQCMEHLAALIGDDTPATHKATLFYLQQQLIRTGVDESIAGESMNVLSLLEKLYFFFDTLDSAGGVSFGQVVNQIAYGDDADVQAAEA